MKEMKMKMKMKLQSSAAKQRHQQIKSKLTFATLTAMMLACRKNKIWRFVTDEQPKLKCVGNKQ